MESPWFIFAKFLQQELDIVKEERNNHYIRRSNFTKISGVPDKPFHFPETRGYIDQGISQSKSDIETILNETDVHSEAEE